MEEKKPKKRKNYDSEKNDFTADKILKKQKINSPRLINSDKEKKAPSNSTQAILKIIEAKTEKQKLAPNKDIPYNMINLHWYLACYYGSTKALANLTSQMELLNHSKEDGVSIFYNETLLAYALKSLVEFKKEKEYIQIIKAILSLSPEMILIDTIEEGFHLLPYQIITKESFYPNTEFLLITKTLEQLKQRIEILMNQYPEEAKKYSNKNTSLIQLLELNFKLFQTAHDDLTTINIELIDKAVIGGYGKKCKEFQAFLETFEQFAATYNLNFTDEDLTNSGGSYGLS